MVAYAQFFVAGVKAVMVYKTVNAVVEQANPALSAAEIHGIAAGMLCADTRTPCATWLAECVNGSALPDSDRALLERLFAETRRLLASDHFEFDLLLPDDEDRLTQRVIALKDWCQGFLYGVGMVAKALWGGRETQEIINDISEFSKLNGGEEGEEDEQAYMEVTEYLRASVMMLRDSFAQNQA